MMKLHPPTSLGMRGSDPYGAGAYGASRGLRIHRGVDWRTEPWGLVRCPVPGLVKRIAVPYAALTPADKRWAINMGVLIAGTGEWGGYEVKMFYISPRYELVSSGVAAEAGDVLGLSLPMGTVYPGITQHVHLELWKAPVGVERVVVDPTPHLEV